MAKKSTNPMIAGGVVILLILVGAGFFLFNKSKSGDGSTILKYSSKNGEVETVTSNFRELMQRGEDYACTFSSTDEVGNEIEGEVFVSDQGEMMNGEFLMTQEDGTTMSSNIIRDGEYNYIWSSAMEDGFKTKISEDDDFMTMPEEGETDRDEMPTFDPDQNFEFECQTWRPDPAKFVPPSDVNFVDFSMTMEKMTEQMEQANPGNSGSDAENACGFCEQLPAGESRTQCLQALGC